MENESNLLSKVFEQIKHNKTFRSLQVSGHHSWRCTPSLHALPSLRQLLTVFTLPHPLLHPVPGGRHLLLVVVRLHQLRLARLGRVRGPGERVVTSDHN